MNVQTKVATHMEGQLELLQAVLLALGDGHPLASRVIASYGQQVVLINEIGRAPLDATKAMTGADVQRIFKPLPPDEAQALRDL